MKATDTLPRKKHMCIYTADFIYNIRMFTKILRPRPRGEGWEDWVHGLPGKKPWLKVCEMLLYPCTIFSDPNPRGRVEGARTGQTRTLHAEVGDSPLLSQRQCVAKPESSNLWGQACFIVHWKFGTCCLKDRTFGVGVRKEKQNFHFN